MLNSIINCEQAFLDLFTNKYQFSDNLIRYEDLKVANMYDHNHFEYNQNVNLNELIDAYKYQQNHNKDFFKLISIYRLNPILVHALALEESTILTMAYDKKTSIEINPKVNIKDVSLRGLNAIELKHYERIYGEEFILKRDKEFIDVSKNNPNFEYLGAYLNNKLVGVCHSFTYQNVTCLDSLLVDNYYRNKHVASTLIKYVIDNNHNIYLHVDNEDDSKLLYQKLGFQTVMKTYEYFREVEVKQ